MTDALAFDVQPLTVVEIAAQVVRCATLAKAGDVVFLAFDRHQRDAGDLRRIDEPAAMPHLAFRQRVANEHAIDGVEIELGRQVHDREILVIELTMLLGGVSVASHEVMEQVFVRLRMTLEVHRDEARELHEAG